MLRITLALLASMLLGALAVVSAAMFAAVVVTKFPILFSGWQPTFAIILFGSSTATLVWLATQAARPLRRRHVSA